MTTRKRIPTAFMVVGSVFAAIGIGLACGAIFVLRYHSGASTMLMGVLAFGWAFLAMVGSMLLALPGKVGSNRMRIYKGTVTVDAGRDIGGLPTSITGPAGSRWSSTKRIKAQPSASPDHGARESTRW